MVCKESYGVIKHNSLLSDDLVASRSFCETTLIKTAFLIWTFLYQQSNTAHRGGSQVCMSDFTSQWLDFGYRRVLNASSILECDRNACDTFVTCYSQTHRHVDCVSATFSIGKPLRDCLLSSE